MVSEQGAAGAAHVGTGAVMEVAPSLLAPVDGWIPADALVDAAPILWIDGPVVDAAPLRRWLRHVPALTVGWGDPDVGCDLWSPDRPAALGLADAAGRHPGVAMAAAVLLRSPPPDVWDGLVAESATYSVLQAGPDFARWLAQPGRPRPGRDTAARVRFDRATTAAPARVTLTRGGRHNALDVQMRDELVEVLDELRRGPDGPVVLAGHGPSFCSGGDLGQFGSFDDPGSAHVVRLQRSVAFRVAELAPRLVVGLHGACLGAGIELPAFARHVIAADDADIGLPEAGIGLIPGAGGTVSIPRRIGVRRTLELIVTGRHLDAAEARAWGLIDEVVPAEQLDDRLDAAARAWAAPPGTPHDPAP